ncbi:MAG: hypothetical protein Q4B28_03450 [bacterium]|nr:hypothetical protein [bacterium]
MAKAWNATGNTLGVVHRGLGTGVLGGVDIVKTGANVFTDLGKVVDDTCNKIWQILSSPYAKGPIKWYHRVGGAVVSPFLALGTGIEGVVRSVLEPGRNVILNARDTLGNSLINLGHSLKWLFKNDKPVSDFSFEKLKTRTVSGDNLLSRLAWWQKGFPPTP